MTAALPRTALLVAAAPKHERSCEIVNGLAEEVDLVIGIDGGAGLCLDCEIVPGVIVGDMDSLPAAAAESLRQAGARFVVASIDKDVTDLDIAFEYCKRHGIERVVVTACTGGRIDHTLAAAGSMARWSRFQPRVVEHDFEGWILEPNALDHVMVSPDGTVFSVIALGGGATVTVEGARWPLDRAVLDPLSSLGVSNVVAQNGARVQVHDGSVMVITNRST